MIILNHVFAVDYRILRCLSNGKEGHVGLGLISSHLVEETLRKMDLESDSDLMETRVVEMCPSE